MRAKKILGLPLPEELTSNKLEDIKEYLTKFYNALDTGYRLLYQDTAEIQVDSDGWIYFGNKDTNGSWRIGRSGNDWNMERRESDSWVAKGAATE